MKRTLKLKKIHWDNKFEIYSDNRPVYPSVDGAVEYEITKTLTAEELGNKRAITTEQIEHRQKNNESFTDFDIINPYSFTMFQPFKKGSTFQTEDGRNIWAWDGNKEIPTLTPSWLMDYPGDYPIRIHLFFTKGKINLLGDSNVELIA